jgi:hypothetical protein
MFMPRQKEKWRRGETMQRTRIETSPVRESITQCLKRLGEDIYLTVMMKQSFVFVQHYSLPIKASWTENKPSHVVEPIRKGVPEQ